MLLIPGFACIYRIYYVFTSASLGRIRGLVNCGSCDSTSGASSRPSAAVDQGWTWRRSLPRGPVSSDRFRATWPILATLLRRENGSGESLSIAEQGQGRRGKTQESQGCCHLTRPHVTALAVSKQVPHSGPAVICVFLNFAMNASRSSEELLSQCCSHKPGCVRHRASLQRAFSLLSFCGTAGQTGSVRPFKGVGHAIRGGHDDANRLAFLRQIVCDDAESNRRRH